jgi:hypothetical protein
MLLFSRATVGSLSKTSHAWCNGPRRFKMERINPREIGLGNRETVIRYAGTASVVDSPLVTAPEIGFVVFASLGKQATYWLRP